MRTGQRAAHGAALLYVLSALPALACPTAADLDGPGVRFIGPTGDSVLHRRIDALRTQADWSPADDRSYISRSILIHGTYPESFGDVENGVYVPAGSVVRPVAPEAMPAPAPGVTYATAQTFRSSDGDVLETLTVSVAETQKVILSGCEFEVFPVTLEFESDGPAYTEEVHYFPGLGTGVLVAVNESDGRFTYDYDQIVVEAAQ